MPIISDKEDSAVSTIKKHLQVYKPAAFELILKNGETLMEQSGYIKEHGARVWVNTLWASLCDGHEDAKALKNADENWGWVIDKGANIIQTDNPKELLKYLKEKGLRDF